MFFIDLLKSHALDTWKFLSMRQFTQREELKWALSPVVPGFSDPTSSGIFEKGSKHDISWVSRKIAVEIT